MSRAGAREAAAQRIFGWMRSSGGDMSGPVNALLRLRSNADGSIAITLSSPSADEPLGVDDAALVVTVWSESPDIVRGRFVDEGSGAIAYFQSTGGSLRSFGRALNFVGPRPS